MSLVNGGGGGGETVPPTSSGSGTPSDTVVGPDGFGSPSDAGTATTYSRGDHDHGLPDAPSGASIGIAELALELTHPVYTIGIDGESPFPFDPVSLVPTDEQAGILSVVPLFSTAPGGTVITYVSFTVTNIDTTNDTFTIGVALQICNLDGTQNLVLSGSAVANAGAPGDTASIAPTSLTIQSQVGSDLAYDDTTGIVSSVAGGSYNVLGGGSGGYS